ncbi:MAG: ATP-binding cassette domain-containing protein [Candidatus Acidiferrales bacterium]
MAAAIEVNGLTKRFGDFTAVDQVSFSVEPGEIFGLLGPNGAGKTTLIRMLTTLIEPSEGEAQVNGFDIRRQPNEVRNSIGVIPQGMTSDLELTAEENLMIHAKLYGVPAERRRQLAEELLHAVDLGAWRHQMVRNFSGGMRRRLEIARGLMHSPKIFFLDEPTTGLDPTSRAAVWEMIVLLKRQSDLTILLTTHYMDEADRLCERVAIVDHGKRVVLDTPARLKANVPGGNIVEVQFDRTPAAWAEQVKKLAGVQQVTQRDGIYRIATDNGAQTANALFEAARAAGVAVTSLSVQSTTLDDVFVHYTGRALRDELSENLKDYITPIYR